MHLFKVAHHEHHAKRQSDRPVVAVNSYANAVHEVEKRPGGLDQTSPESHNPLLPTVVYHTRCDHDQWLSQVLSVSAVRQTARDAHGKSYNFHQA